MTNKQGELKKYSEVFVEHKQVGIRKNYEGATENEAYYIQFFYKFEGEGLRYEIIEFIKRIKDNNMMAGSLTCKDMLAESKVIDCFMKDKYNVPF